MNQEELLQKAKENLPNEYVKAVQNMNLTARINTLGNRYELSERQVDMLDQEVVYLLFGFTGSADFTERLADGLDINDEKLLKIIKQVTADIIKPLQRNVKMSGVDPADIPVPPPPPDGDTPSPSYGGTSDPYREPAEE